MATAVASKPVLQVPKQIKRPQPPFLQTSVNGAKPFQPSPSPSSASKRLPGQTQPANSQTTISVVVNGIARPNRQKKDGQRTGEPRLQRLTTRTGPGDGQTDRRAARKYPEPYVPSESHILKKFKGQSPSLIVHLHPTHFRFDQQDGSFSYHSEMRIFIEHLQKKTVPHDMLEEFRESHVKFYDGWLIVRVVDHKSAANAGTSSQSSSDDQNPFSIHNYNPYITPSPYAPYPAKDQPKPAKPESPVAKQESNDTSNGQDTSSGSSSHINGGDPSKDTIQVASKRGKPQPRVFHVALRPTALSRHMDIVLDSMTPLNRRQSAINAVRTPGSATMPAPPTPLTTVPPTPSFEKAQAHRRQKTKVDPKDLLEYEARIVNSTAPPLYLEPANSLKEAQAVLKMLNDPFHNEMPPSPKGRKRTVAELAADDALAKEQERFMLIMDERNAGGSNAANASNVDGQAAAALFQPRFEKFNALENIKAQHEENKRRELERKVHQDANRRALQEQQQEEERRRLAEAQRQQEELRRRQAIMAQKRQHDQQAAAAALQQPNIPKVKGVPPNMQGHVLHASQAPRSSPVVRTSTPHVNSSPVIGQTSQAGHNAPVGITASSQGGAGSPPRPGSAVQHAHPGVAMIRGGSGQDQGPSRNGTPQIPQGTPSMRHATPVMRQATPSQRMSQPSPHNGMVSQTPQMQPAMVNGMHHVPNGGSNLNPAQMAAMQAARQQQLMQQHAMLTQQGMPNGQHHMSQAQAATRMAQLQAQQQAIQDQQHAMQQHQMQQQQPHPHQQNAGQTQFSQQAYQAQMAKIAREQMHMNQQHQMQQGQGAAGSPPHNQPTPQQHSAQLAHMQQQQQAAMHQHHQNQQMVNGLPPQIRNARPDVQLHFQRAYNAYLSKFMQQLSSQSPNGVVPPHALDRAKQSARQGAMQSVSEMAARSRAGQMSGAMPQQQQQQQQMQQGQNTSQFTAQQYQHMHAQLQAQQQQNQIMNGVPGAGVMPKQAS